MSNSIAQKIARMIALADSTTHPEEASAFMTKAHKLMTDHGLSLLDLGRLSDDPVGLDIGAMETSATYVWLRKLCAPLARYYGADFVYYKAGNKFIYDIAGRESARLTFMLMVPYVKRQVMVLAREAYNRGEYSSRLGAVTAVGNALAIRVWDMLPQVAHHRGEGVNALVPVDLVQQAIDEFAPNAKTARKSKIKFDVNATMLAAQVSIAVQAEADELLKLEGQS